MGKKEIYEEILNKKFQTTPFSGYLPEDVDKFFDYVIEYLKQNEIDVEQFKKTADSLIAENDKLKKELDKNLKEIIKLNDKINQLKADGYGNVLLNKIKQAELDKKGEKK